MFLAKSMRFAGQIVKASECDYNDYKKLGLLCPECGELVFLVRPKTRTIKGKEYKVLPYFSHFKQSKEIAKVCELRVSNYSEKEIKKALAKAQGQRYRFFERWFWNLMCQVPLTSEGLPVESLTSLHDKLYKESSLYAKKSDNYTLLLATILQDKRLKKHLLDTLRNSFENTEFNTDLVPEQDRQSILDYISKLKHKLDLDLHLQICSEAMDFLVSKRNRNMLAALSFNAYAKECTEGKDIVEALNISTEGIMIRVQNIAFLISFINWAEEFQKVN